MDPKLCKENLTQCIALEDVERWRSYLQGVRDSLQFGTGRANQIGERGLRKALAKLEKEQKKEGEHD